MGGQSCSHQNMRETGQRDREMRWQLSRRRGPPDGPEDGVHPGWDGVCDAAGGACLQGEPGNRPPRHYSCRPDTEVCVPGPGGSPLPLRTALARLQGPGCRNWAGLRPRAAQWVSLPPPQLLTGSAPFGNLENIRNESEEAGAGFRGLQSSGLRGEPPAGRVHSAPQSPSPWRQPLFPGGRPCCWPAPSSPSSSSGDGRG